nr:7193_t:CDS:2 [Entrophospora candida]
MGNTKSELDLLKQENARLVARIKELEQIAKEKDELEESARCEAGNVELKAELAKLRHYFEELKQQTQVITNVQDTSSIGGASTTENISPNSSPNEDPSNERILHNKQSIDSKPLEQTQNTISSEINSDNTPEQMENTSDNVSNSDVCQKLIAQCSTSSIYTETKSLEDKEINDFLDRKAKEKLSDIMRDRNREKKLLRNNEDSISWTQEAQGTISSEIKIPYNQKVEQGLMHELSAFINKKSLSNPISDKRITENMLDGDYLTPGSALHLKRLKTGQKEILRCSKKNINGQKARTQFYDEMEPYLPGVKREYLHEMTQKAKNIYTLFKGIGIDKIEHTMYSADAISRLTDAQIQNIINHFPKKSTNSKSEVSISAEPKKKSGTELNHSVDKEDEHQSNTYWYCPICRKNHMNLQEPGTSIDEVLEAYPENSEPIQELKTQCFTSPIPWNHALKFPNKTITVEA